MRQALISFSQLCRLSTQLFILFGKRFERAVAGTFEANLATSSLNTAERHQQETLNWTFVFIDLKYQVVWGKQMGCCNYFLLLPSQELGECLDLVKSSGVAARCSLGGGVAETYESNPSCLQWCLQTLAQQKFQCVSLGWAGNTAHVCFPLWHSCCLSSAAVSLEEREVSLEVSHLSRPRRCSHAAVFTAQRIITFQLC